MKYGLKDSDLTCIVESIKRFHDIDEVVLFGSRAKGNFKKGSDVDLAIRGEKITSNTLSQIGRAHV